MTSFFLLGLALIAQAPKAAPPDTQSFESRRYGLATRIPAEWKVADRERDDRIFVAVVPQPGFGAPGVAACELALAPESLDDYRTRIDRNAEREDGRDRKLAVNQIVKDPHGDRLETMWESHPDSGGFWRDVRIRMVANRQLYQFVLIVEDSAYAKARPAFDAMIARTKFTPPDTGADLLARAENRWLQREYKFAIDLPKGWSPVLAPSSVALLFADGPPHGIWSDNLLVLAHDRRGPDLAEVVRELPDQLRREEPGCEILSCKLIPRGESKDGALETIVRTKRGPFSMTVIEWRFRGERFDYEAKFTVESERFDRLVPGFRKSFESFRELPGAVPATPGRKAA